MHATTSGCIVASMDTIGSRICAARERKGLNQSELGRLLGVSPQSVQAWESDRSVPRSQRLTEIAKALDVPPSDLVDGTPAPEVSGGAAGKIVEMLKKHSGKLSLEQQDRLAKVVADTLADPDGDRSGNVITADFSRSARVRDGELLIPQYDVRGSMGRGQLPADYTEFVRNVVVTEKQLEKLTLKYTEATNLAIITGWGQSMAPTIQDQDPVVVDRGITSYQDDGIYVITWQGHLFIKRVHLASGDKLKIISDCRPHDSDTVDPEDIYVHGKVLYIWNGKKA